MNITILGAGAYALGLALRFNKNNNKIIIWSAVKEEIDVLTKTKMNESTTAQVHGNCSLKENNISSNNIILVKDLKLGDKFHYEGDSDEYVVTVNKINKNNNDAIIYGSYSDGEKVKIKLSLNDEVELAH